MGFIATAADNIHEAVINVLTIDFQEKLLS